MIPILFKEDETNFNSNGIGHLTETVTYEVREVRNGEFELYLEYPVTGRWFTEIKDFRLILAEPNEVDEDHLFRIYETVKSADSQTIFVYGTTKSNDLGGNLVNNVTIFQETAQQALTRMKNALIMPTEYNFVSDIQTKSSTEWLRRNPLNCIAGEDGSLVNYWGGEIKRTNDTIYLYGRRGKDKVATIRPGKNLQGFTLTSSTKGLITRILPFFTYTPEKSDKTVTITGTIVDSPLVNNYPVKYITPVDFTSDETIKTVAQLNTAATKYFATMNPGCDKPSVSIDVDLMQLSDSSEYEKFKALERIQLTDTVTVWVKKYNVDVDVKVTEITYNGMQQMVTNIVAGTSVTNLYDDVKKTYKDDISELHKYVNDMENGVRNTIQIAADGKSTIFRGYTEPDISISKLNDLWYKQLGSGEVEIWIFDGAYWQPLVTAGLNDAVRAEVNKMLAQADVDRANAEQAYEDAIIEGGIYTDEKAAEFNGKLNVVNADLAAQVIKIDANIIKADKAISDANFAKIDATKAIGDAATALSRVVTIEANIQGIQATVANKAEQSQVTQLAGQITTKVESATYNSKMTQLDSAINLRVVQGDVTAAILADKTVKDTRNDNQLPSWYTANFPRQVVEEFKTRSVMGVPGSAPYGQATTTVPWSNSSSVNVIQTFRSYDGTFQRVGNSSDTAWGEWDKIAESGKLISQINISTEGILLQGKRIQLDGDVSMNAAFITRLDVLTLAAVYADIATLKTKVLTADVITSTMIKSDTALIAKLFVIDANVQILTAKTAFINAIKAVTISADKITAGTLNAALVQIINLDASRIVSGTLESITIRGSIIYASEFRQDDSTSVNNTLVQILKTGAWFSDTTGRLTINIDKAGIRLGGTSSTGGATNITNNAIYVLDTFSHNITTTGASTFEYTTFNQQPTFSKGIRFGGTSSDAPNNARSLWVGTIGGATGAWIRQFDSSTVWKRLMMSEDLNATSDYTLKTNVRPTNVVGLDEIRKLDFVSYRWLDEDKYEPGEQFGLIAQNSPFLSIYYKDDNIWRINSKKQMMLNTLAVKELDFKVTSMYTLINSGITLASRALGETEILRNRVAELEAKIKTLESAA